MGQNWENWENLENYQNPFFKSSQGGPKNHENLIFELGHFLGQKSSSDHDRSV